MIRSIAVLFLFLVAGCVSLQTDSKQDPAVELSDLETFAWFDSKSLPGDDVRVNNERVRKTVRDAIVQTLIAKGYRETDTDQADFVVSWFGAIEQKIRKEHLEHLYSPYGYGTLLRDPSLNTEPSRQIAEYEEGTLIIDLLDPVNHRLLWRGAGVGQVIKDRPPETALKNLSRSVSRILDPIPSR